MALTQAERSRRHREKAAEERIANEFAREVCGHLEIAVPIAIGRGKVPREVMVSSSRGETLANLVSWLYGLPLEFVEETTSPAKK